MTPQKKGSTKKATGIESRPAASDRLPIWNLILEVSRRLRHCGQTLALLSIVEKQCGHVLVNDMEPSLIGGIITQDWRANGR